MGWRGEGWGEEGREYAQINPLAGDLHLREIMRQLHYVGEVGSLWGGVERGGVGIGGEGICTNQPPCWRSTSERDYNYCHIGISALVLTKGTWFNSQLGHKGL